MVATVNFGSDDFNLTKRESPTLGSVASLLAATLYQVNPDRNHIHILHLLSQFVKYTVYIY